MNCAAVRPVAEVVDVDAPAGPSKGEKRHKPDETSTGFDEGLPPLIRTSHKCVLKPLHFFVSWHGVLTLVYSGFPPSMVRLKDRIMGAFPALPAENPGSKWPKTSLGCMKDGRRLSPEEFGRLNEICSSFSTALTAAASDAHVVVDVLSVVVFQSRSLEKKFCEMQVELADTPAQEGQAGSVDKQPPSAEEAARVEQVVAAAGEPGYWFFASKDGNDNKHYRGSHHGVTLVHPLQCTLASGSAPAAAGRARVPSAAGLPKLIEDFQAAVEAALPETYSWFSPASLHVTIRGLMG